MISWVSSRVNEMDEKSTRISSFKEFWPYYLAEHSKRSTRLLHLMGTLTGTTCLVLALIFWNPWFLPIGLVSGYAFAWISHFAIEKNKPATFKYPLWSLIADYKMAYMTLIGRKF